MKDVGKGKGEAPGPKVPSHNKALKGRYLARFALPKGPLRGFRARRVFGSPTQGGASLCPGLVTVSLSGLIINVVIRIMQNPERQRLIIPLFLRVSVPGFVVSLFLRVSVSHLIRPRHVQA